MGGELAAAPVTVHFKFGGETDYASVSVSPPATVPGVRAAILRARPDVQKMLASDYVGFDLALSDPSARSSGRPLADDAPPLANDAKVELALSKEYAVRAFDPVRKYVVGRFQGQKPPRFRAGKAATVDWQMTRQRSEIGGAHPSLQLVQGGKQKAVFVGSREGGAMGNFYLLMMQANTTDVCAIPMEQWYNFRPSAPRQVISLEEAEERMEMRTRNTTTTSRWLERAAGEMEDEDELSHSDGGGDMRAHMSSDDEDDNDYDSKRKKKKKRGGGVKEEEENDAKTAAGDVPEDAPGARGIIKAEGDGWEHDEGASDDEGAGEADEMEAEEPPPPPPPRVVHDSDDEDDNSDLDEEGKKVRRLLGRQENGTLSAGGGGSDFDLAGRAGGISDDSDDDDEFVDPDQEELHPFLLAQRNKTQVQKQEAEAAAAAAQKAQAEAAAAAKAAADRRAASAAAAAAAVKSEGGNAAVKSEPAAAAVSGMKRGRFDDDVPRATKSARTDAEVKPEANGLRPIELALREVLRRGAKPTTKDVTKQLRKKGLLNTDEDKNELKQTISRIARIRKEGGVSIVVLL